MARKSWSNLFLLLAALDLAVAVAPGHPVRLIGLLALPVFVASSAYFRRRMI